LHRHPNLHSSSPLVIMGKRGTTSGAAKAPAKKAKNEAKVDAAFTSVGDAVMEAEQLPEGVREMLVEMLPFSLKFASDERHELQTMAVDMVEQALTGKKSALAASLASEDAALASLKASESQLGANVTQAEAALAAQILVVEAKKNASEEATAAEKASQKHLKEEHAGQKAAQGNFTNMQEEKIAIESAFAEHFPPMEAGEGTEGKAHCKKLEPFLKKIDIESTLLTALPSSCAKPKEKRGTFDNLVLQELDKAFKAKIAALGEALVAEGPAAVAREASVQAAEKDHEAKKAAKEHAATDFENAKKEQSDRASGLAGLKHDVENFGPQVEEMTGRLSDAQLALAEFEAGPFTNFNTYKARVAALPEAPEPVAEEMSAEAAPEAAPAEVADEAA